MNQHLIQVIVPVYGAFDYARLCIQSLWRSDAARQHWLNVIIVNDASPDWSDDWIPPAPRSTNRWMIINHERNQGLTAAWNAGFQLTFVDEQSKAWKPPEHVIVAANSDVVVAANWYQGILEALNGGYSFVGPVSNAPGPTSKGAQSIVKWLPNTYFLEDNQVSIDQTGRTLAHYWDGKQAAEPCDINGFFMAARAVSWQRLQTSAQLVFPQYIKSMPSGRRNPDPLGAGQDDWLNSRARSLQLKTGCAVKSFVFHYRSVSRGKKHAHGLWTRRKDAAEI